MPATRSVSSRNARDSHSPYSHENPRAASQTASESSAHEVYVLSSDDNEVPRRTSPRIRAQSNRMGLRSRSVRPSGSSSAIEVLGEDDNVAELVATKKRLQNIKRTLDKTKEEKLAVIKESEALKKQLAAERAERKAERAELEKKTAVDKGKRKEDARSFSSKSVDRLEEIAQCEVCTSLMWSPNILSECGHVFCHKCLSDWFSTTLAQYVQAHPMYDPNALAHNLHIDMRHYGFAQAFMNQQQHPEYTCPTCRKTVTRAPTKCFVVKDIVSIVAEEMGEQEPPAEHHHHHHKGRSAGRSRHPVAPHDPWEGFHFGR